MQIIKLDATESTNTYLKALATENKLSDFTVVTTRNQTLGRGQLNAEWKSEGGKNLVISILKNEMNLTVDKAFVLSISVSLGILEALKRLEIPNLSVKWPNDILSGNLKIGGILIENIISGLKIKESIIGFGLNVNQREFKNLPHAASLKQIVGHDFDLDTVFYTIVEDLKRQLNKPLLALEGELFTEYHTNLFRIGKQSKFIMQDNRLIDGTIMGTTNEGKLRVQLEKGTIQEFGLKEIQLLY